MNLKTTIPTIKSIIDVNDKNYYLKRAEEFLRHSISDPEYLVIAGQLIVLSMASTQTEINRIIARRKFNPNKVEFGPNFNKIYSAEYYIYNAIDSIKMDSSPEFTLLNIVCAIMMSIDE